MNNEVTTKKKPVRRLHARLKNVEVLDGLWTFEMTKQGVTARQRNRRKKNAVAWSLATLASGGGLARQVNGAAYRFTLTEQGLEVVAVISFADLANMGRVQPELFPELASDAEEVQDGGR